MKQQQLSFVSPTDNTEKKIEWWLYVDGASRKNPGPAGAGIFILKDGVPYLKDGIFLGNKTNNQAEYLALLYGLFLLSDIVDENDKVNVIADSQLMVRQMNKVYRVKNGRLKPLYDAARVLLDTLNATITHVLREENKVADEMANKGVDTKKSMPETFLSFLSGNNIEL